MEDLKRRADVLRADVEQRFMPTDIELLTMKQQQKIRDWCAQVPVLGFNSGKCDFNPIQRVLREATGRHLHKGIKFLDVILGTTRAVPEARPAAAIVNSPVYARVRVLCDGLGCR